MFQPVSDFDQRLRRVERRSRLMKTAGYYTRMDASGLVREYPRSRLGTFPWSILALVALGAMLFKAWLFATLGPESYEATLRVLQSGGIADRIGAFLMQPEPLTRALSLLMQDFV